MRRVIFYLCVTLIAILLAQPVQQIRVSITNFDNLDTSQGGWYIDQMIPRLGFRSSFDIPISDPRSSFVDTICVFSPYSTNRFETQDRIAFSFSPDTNDMIFDPSDIRLDLKCYDLLGYPVPAVIGTFDVDIDGPYQVRLYATASCTDSFDSLQEVSENPTEGPTLLFETIDLCTNADTLILKLWVRDRGCAGLGDSIINLLSSVPVVFDSVRNYDKTASEIFTGYPSMSIHPLEDFMRIVESEAFYYYHIDLSSLHTGDDIEINIDSLSLSDNFGNVAPDNLSSMSYGFWESPPRATYPSHPFLNSLLDFGFPSWHITIDREPPMITLGAGVDTENYCYGDIPIIISNSGCGLSETEDFYEEV